MPDLELVERVDSLGSVAFAGDAFRHLGPGYPPLSGEGARVLGGRWNPPDSFPVLYMGLDIATITAEFYRSATRNGMPPEAMLPRKVLRYEIQLSAVLDLRLERARDAIGLTNADTAGDDLGPCQSIGEAAHYLGLEGILAPSAAGLGSVLAVFYAKLRAASFIRDHEYDTWTSLPPNH
ncbi:MAG: RES family NAD+ phosphorylase [Actinomycetota bacterium]